MECNNVRPAGLWTDSPAPRPSEPDLITPSGLVRNSGEWGDLPHFARVVAYRFTLADVVLGQRAVCRLGLVPAALLKGSADHELPLRPDVGYVPQVVAPIGVFSRWLLENRLGEVRWHLWNVTGEGKLESL